MQLAAMHHPATASVVLLAEGINLGLRKMAEATAAGHQRCFRFPQGSPVRRCVKAPARHLPFSRRGGRCLRCGRQRSHRAAPRRPTAGAGPRSGRAVARRASRAELARAGRLRSASATAGTDSSAFFGCRRSGATAPARRRRRGTRPAGGTTPPSPRDGDRIGCAGAGSTSNSAAGSRSTAACRRYARTPTGFQARARPPATPRCPACEAIRGV